MNTSDSYKIADNLYLLLLSLNRNIFNPKKILKKFNIPPSHIKVLLHLFHCGSTPISRIAKDLCISKPNMTPIIDALVDEGLIIRSLDPKDRRVILLETTDKAKDFLHQGEEYFKLEIASKINPLEEDDKLKLEKSIENILEIVSKF